MRLTICQKPHETVEKGSGVQHGKISDVRHTAWSQPLRTAICGDL